ncbi:hypothetical protein [Bacillus sp. SM2101]|uniref:hypothetical protein n=1 Tax=Bacillus sp. SM2101 TaxID=2805366 RepID=UPI001BDF5E66|nr:hypothetical protein [Bacillus sp. SM2101]
MIKIIMNNGKEYFVDAHIGDIRDYSVNKFDAIVNKWLRISDDVMVNTANICSVEDVAS